MSQSMVRQYVCAILLLVLVVVAEADPTPPKVPKPKKVKCKDNKNFPICHKRNDLYCPLASPRNCTVDCVTCTPACTPPPPPPPRPTKGKKKESQPLPTIVYSSPPPPPSNVYSSPPPPLRTPSSPLPPTPSAQTSGKKARCKNKNFPKCYMTEHACPSSCKDHCEVDCVTCSPVCNCNKPGAICQDPRFVGADGLTFYFHGKKDKDFCIVSDSNIHINAHFIGKRNTNMKRDFTWIQSLGILFGTHQLFIGAKKTPTWDDSTDRLTLTFDGESLIVPTSEGAKWQSMVQSGVSVIQTRDVNAVEIEVEGNFKIKATVVPITAKESEIHKYGINDDDFFAHLDISFKFYSLSGDVNGVLGQTYGNNYVSRVKMGTLMSVLGGDHEFASYSLFSTDCSISRFNGRSNSSDIFEYDNLKCASGMDGQGVVCKR